MSTGSTTDSELWIYKHYPAETCQSDDFVARRPFQFGLGALLLLTTLAGPLMALVIASPPLATFLIVMAIPAAVRTERVARNSSERMPARRIVSLFLISLLTTIFATIVSFANALALAIAVANLCFTMGEIFYSLAPIAYLMMLATPLLALGFGLTMTVFLLRAFWNPRTSA